MKKLFLIIGAPGSGKTTDAELIASNHQDITHYSTGDMFRMQVASGSELGKTIDRYVSAGHLVPIDIVIDTITTAIKNSSTSTILIDGYPRSEEQMLRLNEYLENNTDIQLINVLEVKVSEDVARDRVLGRARGADDNNEVFDNRIKIYTEPLSKIQDFYSKKNLLVTINGERTIKEIVNEMDTFIRLKINFN